MISFAKKQNTKRDTRNKNVAISPKKNSVKVEKNKVRDYCYYTGQFRGITHNMCNIRYKTPKENSVIFNNGSKYDYHFIVKELG